MAYVIRLATGEQKMLVAQELQDAVNASQFTCTVHTFRQRPHDSIQIEHVRLREKKPYCGQHPGVCENPFGRTMNAKFLEWNDWVAFHDLVNDVLDRLQVKADAYTEPLEKMDHGRRMFVRRMDAGRRVKWFFTRTYTPMGVPRDVWNHGTPDQFEKEALHEIP